MRAADMPVAIRAPRRPPGETAFLAVRPFVFVDRALQQGGRSGHYVGQG